MKIKEVLGVIDRFAPFSQRMEPDNCGLLVGDPEADTQRILCALDITHQVVEQAKQLGCGLIVSHHPVIFTPLSSLKAGSVPYLLAVQGISAICAHTSLDCAAGGVNDALARLLGLTGVKPFGLPDGSDAMPLGRIGRLPRTLSAAEFEQKMTDLFGPVQVTGSRPVEEVAVCGGSGGDWMYPAAELGADAFVTGELRHHQHLDAAKMGITAVAAGHFATEAPVRQVLAELLRQAFPEAHIFVSKEEAPYRTLFPGKDLNS